MVDKIIIPRPRSCGKSEDIYRSQHMLQSMIDELDYMDGLRPLKREVLTSHLVPRKMSYGELKQDILIPLMIVACFFGVGVLWL